MVSPSYTDMRIVLIDDDAMVLRSLEAALLDFGFPVQAFQDPEVALRAIEADGADIVITDIRMPKCDGFEVLRRLKEIDPDCNLIFVTAHGQLETAVRALREGATDFFEKPFTSDALKAAIERTSRFRLLARQKQLLTDQVNLLTRQASQHQTGVMLGRSAAMQAAVARLMDVAATQATVLILGESGTGKELAARAIHDHSDRRDKPFITVNCPSIPEDLFESELFGHRRGAFTGAVETRGGYVDAARGGTLFLDEIGDLPLKAQAKMLRLLEQKTYLAVGENREKSADIRVIAATNQHLEDLVANKTFREDLYYRLSVCLIPLPPLRDRKEDIPLIAAYFAMRFASEMGKPIDGIDNDGLRRLAGHDYPGNVRELRNVIESAVIHCKHGGLLGVDDFALLGTRKRAGQPAPELESWPGDTLNFREVERRVYEEALRRTDNNISAAARLLGLSRGKLRRRLAVLNGEVADDDE